MKNCGGFSFVEIIVAMLILTGVGAMTMSAFTNSIEATRPGSSVAYHFGRGILERMYEFVRQDQWATAGLPLSTTNPGTAGPYLPQNAAVTLNGITYRATYTVTAQNLDSNNAQDDLRRVRMTITW